MARCERNPHLGHDVCVACVFHRPSRAASLPGDAFRRFDLFAYPSHGSFFAFCMHAAPVDRQRAPGSMGGALLWLGFADGQMFPGPADHNASSYLAFRQACQRYWTEGGTLRNVPVGAGRRKNSKAAAREGDAKHAAGGPTTAPAAVAAAPLAPFPQLMPDAVLLSALGAPAAAAAPAEPRAPCGAAEPRADPAEHVRLVRPRLEPLPAVGESLWPASGEAGPAFGEWASMAAQQQLQQHAALQAAAFGQAQLMGAGWGGGGNPYLPLWPYNMYGGPSWAAYAGCVRRTPPLVGGCLVTAGSLRGRLRHCWACIVVRQGCTISVLRAGNACVSGR